MTMMNSKMTEVAEIMEAAKELLEAEQRFKVAADDLRRCEIRFDALTNPNNQYPPLVKVPEVVVTDVPIIKRSKGYAKAVLKTMKENPYRSFSYKDFALTIPQSSLPQTFGWLCRQGLIYKVGHKHFKLKARKGHLGHRAQELHF